MADNNFCLYSCNNQETEANNALLLKKAFAKYSLVLPAETIGIFLTELGTFLEGKK